MFVVFCSTFSLAATETEVAEQCDFIELLDVPWYKILANCIGIDLGYYISQEFRRIFRKLNVLIVIRENWSDKKCRWNESQDRSLE